MNAPIRAIMLLFVILAHPGALQAQNLVGNAISETARPDRPNMNRGRPTDTGHADWAVAELIRIDGQRQTVQRRLSQIAAVATSRGRIEEASRTLAELKNSPALACGAPAEARAAFNNSLRQTLDSLGFISGNLPSLYPWEEFEDSTLNAACGPQMVAVLQRIEAGASRMGRDLEALASSREDLNRELAELESRKRTIITQMSDSVASARVTKTMPWILGAIFLFGVTSMLGTRLFSSEIQSELIGSGQLVQFVTILILFGALLALGLADKLQEQTLAALLGGLAGYVLSQGVGQKERRSTLETVRQLVGPNPLNEAGQPQRDGAALTNK
jgi:hypothetical protein